MRDVIRDQATEAGMQFVDPLAEKWFVGAPELIGVDGIHPTDQGHKYLAERVAPVVKQAYDGH